MIFRLFPLRDTFITNKRVGNVPMTASNVGASEILHVFKFLPSSGSAELARILSYFDLAGFTGIVPTSGAVKYFLRMADAQHDQTLPEVFDLSVQAATQDWTEGNGIDVDDFSDKGFANWDRAKKDVFWSVPGASGSGPVASAHFATGHEDLKVDVTSIVDQWLSGSITNNGFLVKMSGALETDATEYYIKMFHGRNTHFGDKVPYLEAAWDDTIQTGSVTLGSGDGQFFVNVTNLKNQYDVAEVAKLKLFIRPRDYNPAVVATASLGPTGVVMDKAYYRIVNDRTEEVVVPFGTGSIPFTKLSYNANGNHFTFHMSNLPRGNVYRVVFLFDVGGQKQLVDEGFKFRVV